MPDPDIVAVSRLFRDAINSREGVATARLIESYVGVLDDLIPQIDKLASEIRLLPMEQITRARIDRLFRRQKLSKKIIASIDRFATEANIVITEAQRDVVALASAQAKRLSTAALPEALTVDTLAALGVEWTTLSPDALEVLVGTLSDGSPLSAILERLGPGAARDVQKELVNGLVQGRSPRVVARRIKVAFGNNINRAMAVSRTEILRSHREAQRATYQANSEENGGYIKGVRRFTFKDRRTCMACLAMDNTFYKLEESYPTHVNCRCAFVPETISFRELGIDVDETPIERENGEDWFKRQSKERQLEMLGPGKFELYESGKIEFRDFVHTDRSRKWGDSEREATLAQLSEIVDLAEPLAPEGIALPLELELDAIAPATYEKTLESLTKTERPYELREIMGDDPLNDRVHQIEWEDGTIGIRKRITEGETGPGGTMQQEQTRSALLSTKAGRLLGVDNIAGVAFDGEFEFQLMIKGTTPQEMLLRDETPDKVNFKAETSGALESDDSMALGFFDYVTGQRDRHKANWIIADDGRVWGIDHDLSFGEPDEFRDVSSPFAQRWMRHMYGTEKFRDAKKQMVSLRDEMVAAGKEKAYDGMISRLDYGIKHGRMNARKVETRHLPLR